MDTIAFNTEMERVFALAEYNLDYGALCNSFNDLTQLAAKFAGTDISLVNLLDSYQQWTVGKHGIAVELMAREETVCDYTIRQDHPFEVKDLSADERFRLLGAVTGPEKLRYYYGVPITTAAGHRLGALCVLDRKEHEISPEKAELLRILAREVVSRLNTFKQVENLQQRINELTTNRRILAHDIRGPLGGIVGLAQLGTQEVSQATQPDIHEYFELIVNSGRSAISMTEDILRADREALKTATPADGCYNLYSLQTTLEDLFLPLARRKQLALIVKITPETAGIRFNKGMLLQPLINLVANAIKFTPSGGTITVELGIVTPGEVEKILQVRVSDTGQGMTDGQINAILSGKGASTAGTQGEQGFGFGLNLVKALVDKQNGQFNISSAVGEGAVFSISLHV